MRLHFKKIIPALLVSAALNISGCGGGGGSDPAVQKTAVVAFRTISSATLPFRVNAISIAAVLPAGISLAMDTQDAHQVSASALSAGSTVTGSVGTENAIFGRYSASGRKVKIDVADTSTAQAGFGPGEFARLNCSVTAGTTLTEPDFTAINAPFPYFKVFGYNEATHSTVDLTGYLQPTLTVTFGY